jgi:hypothetical protein
MLGPNPNFFKKIKNYLTFASAGLLSRKNRFRMEPAGSRKKTGSVRNRSKAVLEAGLNRFGSRTDRTDQFCRFRSGSCNTGLTIT